MKALPLGHLARARASLDAGIDPGRVLETLGVDRPTWATEEEALLILLADDVERGELGRLEEYRIAYRAAWVELTGHAWASEEPGSTTMASAAKLPTPEATLSPREPERSARVQRASFQLTRPPNHPSSSLASPELRQAPIRGSEPVSRPKREAPVVETAEVDFAPFTAALPFGATPTTQPRFDLALRAPPHPEALSTDTEELDRMAVGREVVPFEPSNPLQQPASPPPLPANVTASVVRSESGQPRTAFLRDDPNDLPKAPALPFQEGRPVPHRTALRTAAWNVETDSQPPRPGVTGGASLPVAAPTSVRFEAKVARPDVTLPPGQQTVAPSLPFAGASALMPLERYAQVTVELERDADPDVTFRRLGLQPETWMATVRRYARLFADDSMQQATFDALLKKARDNAR